MRPYKRSSSFTNVLENNTSEPSNTKINNSGKDLIAYAQNSSLDKEEVFLLHTAEPLSTNELSSLAEEYKNSIPEFIDVEIDQEMNLSTTPVIVEPSPVEALPARKEEENVKTNVRIALIDSGIDTEHELFKDKHIAKGWNAFTDDSSMDDDIGHGTHIAGIITMESPDAELIPYKVKNKESGKLSNVIKALNKAIDAKVDIINMSFGFSKGPML